MIGLQDAWDIIRASGVEMGPAHVGVIDSPVYTNSGHSFGPDLHFPDDKGATRRASRVPGVWKRRTSPTNLPTTAGVSHGTQVAHIIGADPESWRHRRWPG